MGSELERKAVLVSYLERQKVLKIDAHKISDVKFLALEFRKQFAFNSNVNLVTFQRFDSEWGEYVELESDDEIEHKDKLKAVVTPFLVTPAESRSGERSSEKVGCLPMTL